LTSGGFRIVFDTLVYFVQTNDRDAITLNDFMLCSKTDDDGGGGMVVVVVVVMMMMVVTGGDDDDDGGGDGDDLMT